MNETTDNNVRAVLFDYGGVLAEEGFREGLMEIGRKNGLNPNSFFEASAQAVYDSGYVVGKSDEAGYWEMVRRRTGIDGNDSEWRSEIMNRFVLRPWMMQLVKKIRSTGYKVAILSDQTDWLDVLDRRDRFFKEFDRVFNSFHMGKGKKDATLFGEVAAKLGLPPETMLFIDDNHGHVQRALSQGLQAILFTDRDALLTEIESYGLPI